MAATNSIEEKHTKEDSKSAVDISPLTSSSNRYASITSSSPSSSMSPSNNPKDTKSLSDVDPVSNIANDNNIDGVNCVSETVDSSNSTHMSSPHKSTNNVDEGTIETTSKSQDVVVGRNKRSLSDEENDLEIVDAKKKKTDSYLPTPEPLIGNVSAEVLAAQSYTLREDMLQFIDNVNAFMQVLKKEVREGGSTTPVLNDHRTAVTSSSSGGNYDINSARTRISKRSVKRSDSGATSDLDTSVDGSNMETEFGKDCIDIRNSVESPVTSKPYIGKPKVSWGRLISQTGKGSTPINSALFTMGRHWKCNLQLLHQSISRLFCSILHFSGVVMIERLSKHGSLHINSWPIALNTKEMLRNGDEITILGNGVRYSYIFEQLESIAHQPATAMPSGITTTSAPICAGDASQKASTSVSSVQEKQSQTTDCGLNPDKVAPKATVRSSSTNCGSPTVMRALEERFSTLIVRWNDITVSLDEFPYAISDDFRKRLVDSVFIYLRRSDMIIHTDKLSSMHRGTRIVGPPGTERCQELLVRALAQHLKVDLLCFESSLFDFVPNSSASTAAAAVSTDGIITDYVTSTRATMDSDEIINMKTNADVSNARDVPSCDMHMEISSTEDGNNNYASSRIFEVNENKSLVQPAAAAAAVTETVEISDSGKDSIADENESSEFVIAPDFSKPEAKSSTSSHRERHQFRVGDVVRYVRAPLSTFSSGGNVKAFFPGDAIVGGIRSRVGSAGVDNSSSVRDAGESLESINRRRVMGMVRSIRRAASRQSFIPGTSPSTSSSSLGAVKTGENSEGALLVNTGMSTSHNASTGVYDEEQQQQRTGPTEGARGTVVLSFPENPNSQKVGVMFDRPFPGAISIDGETEKCGAFVSPSDLRLDNQFRDLKRHDKDVVEAIFNTAAASFQTTGIPVILFVSDGDKALSQSQERVALFKYYLAKVDFPLVMIGSSVNDGNASSLSVSRPQSVSLGGSGSAAGSSTGCSSPSTMGGASGSAGNISNVPTGNGSTQPPPPQLFFMERVNGVFSTRSLPAPSIRSSLARMLPARLVMTAPDDPKQLATWRKLIRRDVNLMTALANAEHLCSVLERSNVRCAALEERPLLPSGSSGGVIKLLRVEVLSLRCIDMVVGWALSDLARQKGAEKAAATLVNSCSDAMDVTTIEGSEEILLTSKEGCPLDISLDSIRYGLEMLVALKKETRGKALTSLVDVKTDNEFENRLMSSVIPASEIGVTFDDIGALTKVKSTLFELVTLPLKRPELFQKGNLTKPCKGILLFGPPGTGKTMLAKALAAQSGAAFLNITLSSITSKWVGEGEKYAKAVFTVASKIAPCVIFVDEIDSMLGKRDSQYEHEGMRKIKNEFMLMWDGLTTKSNERITVLAASNRPFDLDDAVLRRLPRRVLVDLPDAEQRAQILKVILRAEDVKPELAEKLALMLDGYSGSDMKNLCIAAAHIPIREFLEQEKKKAVTQGKDDGTVFAVGGGNGDTDSDSDLDEPVEPPHLRGLTISDFEAAKTEVSASCQESAVSIGELRKWNELYGEGGNGWKTPLAYFL